MHRPLPSVAVCGAAAILSACAALPAQDSYIRTRALAQASGVTLPAVDEITVSPIRTGDSSQPLDVEAAVALAYRQGPRMRELQARLGLGQAAFEDARRLPNPRIGYSRLDAGEGSKLTRSVGFGLGDALLLPLRHRLASAEYERLQQAVAAELVALGVEVEDAWVASVSATQVEAMRELVADAAQRSADLAQRFFDAGNIDRLQLERELAAAAQARIAAVRAGVAAAREKAAFAALTGLSLDGAWSLQAGLPAPIEPAFDAATLEVLAQQQRLDLAAARSTLATSEAARRATRRWRWLGDIDIDYEWEREPGGERARGPSLQLELPIFDQGQGEMARADVERLRAASELDALELAVGNDVRIASDALRIAYDVVERYRVALLPRREAVVARMQERVNYMLSGVFELIQARQDEYDAYQEYLEAVRDYWIAYGALRRAVGGSLPAGTGMTNAILGVDAILPDSRATDRAHEHHDHADAEPAGTDDPHAHHRGHSEAQPAPDHAGHDEPATEAHEHHHEHGDQP